MIPEDVFSRTAPTPPRLAGAPSEYTDAMAVLGRLPFEVDVVVIGAGFAGASVAAGLTRVGVTSGLVLERELLPGTHASGRNAAMARQVEADPVLRKLATEGVHRLRAKTVAGCPVLRQSGGLYLIHGEPALAAEWCAQLDEQCVPAELLSAVKARQRFPFLGRFRFHFALFCPTDGIVDIHALLSDLLAEARHAGFEIITNGACESLILEGSVVRGVRTKRGEIQVRTVVDAAGAWAGCLGRESAPLPLKRLRRHLFVPGGTRPAFDFHLASAGRAHDV